MKLKNAIVFILIIAVVGMAGFTAFNGLQIGEITIRPMQEAINQGLDLKGGVYVVYEAETDETGRELDQTINQTIEVFRRRVDAMGLTEPSIVREGDHRIRVELPGVENAQEALDMIGRTAQLQFITQEGEVVVTGTNVRKAEATFVEGQGSPVVSLEFDSEGTRNFADATAAHIGEPIFIILDEEIISAPTVENPIPNGRAIISGNFTVESASQLAALIRGGALPVNLREVQTSTITATLGVNALERSITAATIGFMLVLLFMLLFYRLPGFVANVALAIYILLVLGILVALNATLTLPGIAALILSVGMAVDANVIIFERIKEELRAGKTIRSAIDAGFKRATRAILDSNITTLIAGIVLYQFGTGPIRGFALTLIIGIVVSMFTAIIITKFLLKLIVGMDLTKNSKLFGA
ncbi:protein-export membrane protein SecD [Clostridium aceticum]|uniref:Protein translocase subunit SecD n=1 Tax=Clostridium aceticum TaxID=84022 RepID=A0A0D8IDJ1_9CLOT|nr:protein translocase subunit SecD [Clostridium aceticum]AKL95179.1 protein-export membrane protein SecD [Clostridium aceticum]KJF28052.1 preprotein translocase subunit SecD [Clostridium aceticum]